MKRIAILSAVAALAVAAPAALAATPSPATSAPAAAAAVKQYEGTIVSVNRSNRTFRLRDAERGTVRIRVTSRTRFQRIAGFSSLKSGMTRIEATVHRSGGSWVANSVERSGGGGGGGKHNGNDD
jgi:hypothetical protein